MAVTDSFISAINSFSSRSFSDQELHQLKRCVLDWLGVSYAGAKVLSHRLDPLIPPCGVNECSSFVSDNKMDMFSAAFVNGFAAHILELDDGHRFGMLHLEALIMPAMLAVCQKEHLGFDSFVRGVMVGYQTTVKLARLIQPYHKKCGFHATGTCGTIGVAVAASVALGLDDSGINNAIGAAVTQASGLLVAIDSPSEMKPYNIAGAVESGLRAAYLAKCGFTGPDDPLDGKRGFLKVYAPKGVEIHDELYDSDSEILNIYFKPYVSCRHCHAPVECSLMLRSGNVVQCEHIVSITVETYLLAISGHDSKDIDTPAAAKMSIPYCVAVSIYSGHCGMDEFSDEIVHNPVVHSIMDKVNVIEDEEMTKASPGKRGARVKILFDDGVEISKEVDNPLGEPDHPMSDEEIEEKYFNLMSFASVPKNHANSLRDMVWNLDSKFEEFKQIL